MLIVWRNTFKFKKFKTIFLISLIILFVALLIYSKFLNFNESRNGVSFEDPFLSWFSPINATWFIFTLIYGGLILGIVNLIRHPKHLLIAIQTYTLIIFVRIIAMYSLPLNPPPHTIPLVDPFVQLFGSGKVLMKDLFFSGHTATMFMLFLTAPTKKVEDAFSCRCVFNRQCRANSAYTLFSGCNRCTFFCLCLLQDSCTI